MEIHRSARRAAWVSGLVVLSACVALALAGAQATAPAPSPGDWPSYNRTLAGERYSPLAEITTANVARLRTICSHTLPEVTSLQTGTARPAGLGEQLAHDVRRGQQGAAVTSVQFGPRIGGNPTLDLRHIASNPGDRFKR
jgi:hypothetical protein